jgi:uncharacterized cupin superfamily protein
MEMHPGVFTSDIDTDEWEPVPDFPGSEFHNLVETNDFRAGLWRVMGNGNITFPWTPPLREAFLVLEGEVRIEIANGPALDLKPGSMASLAPGVETTWHVTTPFKDMYVMG